MSDVLLRTRHARLPGAESAFIAEARAWTQWLVKDEARFPGDWQPAMRRVARKAGVPPGTVWGLTYRRPKSIRIEHWAALGAYFRERQRRKYGEERAKTAATTALGRLLVGAADVCAGDPVGGAEARALGGGQ